eukprot:symbB.v1.2.004251.t2/scaffold241.1/size254724/6
MPMIQWSFECLIQVMCRTDCWNGLIFYPTDDPKHDTNVFFGTSLFDSEFPQSLVLESPRWGLDAQVHTSSDGWLRKKLANIHRKRGEKHPGRICVFADEKHASKLELYFKMTASQLQTGEFWKRKPDAFFVVNRCQVVGTDEWNLEELGLVPCYRSEKIGVSCARCPHFPFPAAWKPTAGVKLALSREREHRPLGANHKSTMKWTNMFVIGMSFPAIIHATGIFNATPTKLMSCSSPVDVTSCMSFDQYDAIVTAVRNELESLPSTCTASNCPQADWAGCVLRMAGHDFMDFANGQGGSDACTDMEDPENAGLPECLSAGEHGKSLQDVYHQICHMVSLADFLVIAAEAVIASTRARHEAATAGAPSLDLRSRFKFGRQTASSCSFAVGRLPDPERGCVAVDETFVQRMGLSWSQAAALMGVHTLGRAKVENSGYHGWWSDPENSRRFNNNYYVSLVAKGWIPEHSISGNSNKNQWERSDIGRDTSTDGHEMMLNTDVCLVWTEGPQDTPVVAKDENCCAWLQSRIVGGAAIDNNGGEFCGSRNARGREERQNCCGNNNDDCGDEDDPQGPAANAVLNFAADEGAWINTFVVAWGIATENGHTSLQSLKSTCGETSTSPSTTTTESTTSTTTTAGTTSTTTMAGSTGTTTMAGSTSTTSTTKTTGSTGVISSDASTSVTTTTSEESSTLDLFSSASRVAWGTLGLMVYQWINPFQMG